MVFRQLIHSFFQFLRTNYFLIATTFILYYGWTLRDDNYITAENGVGYTLGIVGGVLMLILLLYPLSKRASILTRILPSRYWFGYHMILGIIGPTMILFHSNFHMSSINSSIALICMLLVAGSGLVGRYIYTHIHHGLYGTRIDIKELKQQSEKDHSALVKLFAMDEKLNKQLLKMENKALQEYTGIVTSLMHVIYLGIHAPRIKRKVMKLLKNSYAETSEDKILPDNKVVAKLVNHYTLALRRTAAFRVYERLFSLWHILHLPLFFMMIITAIIHVFAVHLY